MAKLEFIWRGQKIVKVIDAKTILNDIRNIEPYHDSFNSYGYFYWFYIDWNIQEIIVGLQGEDIKLTTIKKYSLKF